MMVGAQGRGGFDADYLGAIGQLQQPDACNGVPEGISTAPPSGLVYMARTAQTEQAVPATSRRP